MAARGSAHSVFFDNDSAENYPKESENLTTLSFTPDTSERKARDWTICGERMPKNQVTFFSQIIVVYGVIIVSIVHISLQSPNQELWLVLLSSAFGYILPNPGLKYVKPRRDLDSEGGALSGGLDMTDARSTMHLNEDGEKKN